MTSFTYTGNITCTINAECDFKEHDLDHLNALNDDMTDIALEVGLDDDTGGYSVYAYVQHAGSKDAEADTAFSVTSGYAFEGMAAFAGGLIEQELRRRYTNIVVTNNCRYPTADRYDEVILSPSASTRTTLTNQE